MFVDKAQSKNMSTYVCWQMWASPHYPNCNTPIKAVESPRPCSRNTYTVYIFKNTVAPTSGTNKTNLGYIYHSNPSITIFLKMTKWVLHHVANTIAWDIFERGHSRAARKIYAKQVFMTNIISPDFSENIVGIAWVNIIFSKENAICINPYYNDPLVINIQHGKWDIMLVLIDSGRSVNVLF